MARSVDSGERQELFAAYDGDRMVGSAVVWSFLLDNQDKCELQVNVDPSRRRRGVRRPGGRPMAIGGSPRCAATSCPTTR